jgi:hypothetical protein
VKRKGRTAPGGSSGGRKTGPEDPRWEAFVWAIARGATKTEAATEAGIARSTATRWTTLAEFDDAVREATKDSVETLRKRAFGLAMGGNIRLLIWLLEHRDEISASVLDPDFLDAADGESGVREVEIIGVGTGGREHDDGNGPVAGPTGGGAFIEFVEDDG